VVASKFLPTTGRECVVLVRTRTHTRSSVADALLADDIEMVPVECED
jgi:hypothetical protein